MGWPIKTPFKFQRELGGFVFFIGGRGVAVVDNNFLLKSKHFL